MEETTNKVTKGCALEEEAREKAEAKAYLVEKYYYKQHGYIPRFISAPILLANSICMISMCVVYAQTGFFVLFLLSAILFMVLSIETFVKALKIRRRRNIAASRMLEYERKHPEAVMPGVAITIGNEKKETPTSADELLKWKKLLDEGAITQEEYDAKKKQILGL